MNSVGSVSQPTPVTFTNVAVIGPLCRNRTYYHHLDGIEPPLRVARYPGPKPTVDCLVEAVRIELI